MGFLLRGAYIPLHLCPELQREHGLVRINLHLQPDNPSSLQLRCGLLSQAPKLSSPNWSLAPSPGCLKHTSDSKVQNWINYFYFLFPVSLRFNFYKWFLSDSEVPDFSTEAKLCNIKVAFVKCAIQWHLVHPQRRAAISTIWFHHPKEIS